MPDIFPELTVNTIRLCFTQHSGPLGKASCLGPVPAEICWGMVDRGIDEPTLWINPYLAQALEAAREVHNGEH
jgi:hypothetical protein